MFTGLIAEALNVCVMSLDDDEMRAEFEVMFIANAYANNLQHDGKFL